MVHWFFYSFACNCLFEPTEPNIVTGRLNSTSVTLSLPLFGTIESVSGATSFSVSGGFIHLVLASFTNFTVVFSTLGNLEEQSLFLKIFHFSAYPNPSRKLQNPS
jgi:hypothetical protein